MEAGIGSEKIAGLISLAAGKVKMRSQALPLANTSSVRGDPKVSHQCLSFTPITP